MLSCFWQRDFIYVFFFKLFKEKIINFLKFIKFIPEKRYFYFSSTSIKSEINSTNFFQLFLYKNLDRARHIKFKNGLVGKRGALGASASASAAATVFKALN